MVLSSTVQDISPPAQPGVVPRDASACGDCHLAPACLPARLSLPDRDRLRRLVHPLAPLKRNQSLFEGGNADGCIYIVRSGSLRTSVQEAGGDEQVVDFHLPGDITGHGTGIETFRGGRAVALERTSVCAVRLAPLRHLATQISGLQEQIYALLERAITASEQHVLMMGRRSAGQRIALFLHNWSRRRQRAGFSGDDLYLPMRREDMASYLGLVTETASRSISRLHRTGIIDVRDRHNVRVLQADELAQLARIDPQRD